MNKKTINREILRCPNCGQEDLLFNKNIIRCSKCSSVYRFKGGKYFFIQKNATNISEPLDKLKYKFKKYSTLYSLLIMIVMKSSSKAW